jgi:hypothetical protein
VTAGFTDVDWDHAIRYALRPGGSWVLPFMPYHLFSRMTDGDTTALIAYLKIVPRVDRVLPPTKLRLPGYVMVGLPRFDLDDPAAPRGAGRLRPPIRGPTASYAVTWLRPRASSATARTSGEASTWRQTPRPRPASFRRHPERYGGAYGALLGAWPTLDHRLEDQEVA